MRKVVHETDNQWIDATGDVFEPGEPPIFEDAQSRLFRAWMNHPGDEDIPPTQAEIEPELERLREQYATGEWHR